MTPENKKTTEDEEEIYDSNVYEAVKTKEGILIKKKKKEVKNNE